MSVLADSSVWVDHWRRGNPHLAALLASNEVATHPLVIGELALGALSPRAEVLADLKALRSARLAEHEEVLALVESRRLAGAGIGWVDCHLLASAMLDRLRLWTLDRRLSRIADQIGAGYPAS